MATCLKLEASHAGLDEQSYAVGQLNYLTKKIHVQSLIMYMPEFIIEFCLLHDLKGEVGNKCPKGSRSYVARPDASISHPVSPQTPCRSTINIKIPRHDWDLAMGIFDRLPKKGRGSA